VFSLTISGGILSGPLARSTADGLASPSGWKLGTLPGEQGIIARAGSQTVTFRATVAPGPAVTITKLAGDDQEGPIGAAVPIPPAVQVHDAYENPIAGMTVNFAIEAGGGAVSSENATTNSAGIATIESWTLGLAEDQRLVASAGSLAPVTFRATAFDPENPCRAFPKLTPETVERSTLTDAACRSADGYNLDKYSVTVPQQGVLHFKLVSSAFDTRLELRDEKGTPIASNRTDNSTTNSEIKAILPAGRITVVVTSMEPGGTGAYEVSYAIAASGADGCEISIARGVSTSRSVSSGDPCTLKGALPADRYRIYMTAGSTLSVLLEDFSLSDNRFELQDDNGRLQAPGVVRNYVESTIDFTARDAGYYVIFVQVYEQYFLRVR
jgi:hypothetical protein